MEKIPARNRRSHRLTHACLRPARLPSALTGRAGSRSQPSRQSATNPTRSLGGPHVVPRRVVGTPNGPHGERAAGRPNPLRDRQSCMRMPGRPTVALNGLDRGRRRADMRDWGKARIARLHRPIERDGLARNEREAGPLPDDPRHVLTRWRRRGVRAVGVDREPLSPQPHVRRQEGIR